MVTRFGWKAGWPAMAGTSAFGAAQDQTASVCAPPGSRSL